MSKEITATEGADMPAETCRIDITRDTCPMTFVRTRLALDRMAAGEVLLVTLRGEEPRRNVPRTATEQGHAVLGLEEETDGTARLWIRKGG
ncbi:sulfurtransferase TusA family protein [Pararoseomonas sp. SCSIO 73927]|uniref:sulfurtransferase TusA family protein n=1 Tax=Pararoseomonas sp. SCSIO 73927 TaxID=3114537 RepID=UPI0030CD4443